jgi:hypothetical protein
MSRRRPLLHDALARLALAAMLALAALPTLGRLHAPAAAFEAMSGASATMCRVRPPGTQDMPAPDRPQAPHTDDDCAYCPLLAALATPAVATWSPVSPPPMPRPARATASCIALVVAIGHLGPRGPPARVA